MLVSAIPVTRNRKLGAIAAIAYPSATCPPTCGLQDVCYGKGGPQAIQWKRLDAATVEKGNTISIARVPEFIKGLQEGTMVRDGVVGDQLARDGELLPGPLLDKANTKRRVFGFSHHSPLIGHNNTLLNFVWHNGITIRSSADNLDQLATFPTNRPAAVMLPSSTTEKVTYAFGRTIVTCPAALGTKANCMECSLCADPSFTHDIGFPSHGSKKRKADIIAATN